MLDAETEDRPQRRNGHLITQEELDAKEREGLCDLRSVEIFFTWRAFGGMAANLSLTEILAMPSWLRRDFLFLSKLIGSMRDDRSESEAFFDEIKDKPAKRTKAPKRRTRR